MGKILILDWILENWPPKLNKRWFVTKCYFWIYFFLSIFLKWVFCFCSICITIFHNISKIQTYLLTYQLFNVWNPHGWVGWMPACSIIFFKFIALLHTALSLASSLLRFSNFKSTQITSQSLLFGRSLDCQPSV